MADPIVVVRVVERKPDPRQPTLATFTTAFLYSLSGAQILDALGRTCVPTPAVQFPPDELTALSPSEVSGLDSGALGFEIRAFDLLSGQALVTLVNAARAAYPQARAQFIAQETKRWERFAFRVSVSGVSV